MKNIIHHENYRFQTCFSFHTESIYYQTFLFYSSTFTLMINKGVDCQRVHLYEKFNTKEAQFYGKIQK